MMYRNSERSFKTVSVVRFLEAGCQGMAPTPALNMELMGLIWFSPSATRETQKKASVRERERMESL